MTGGGGRADEGRLEQLRREAAATGRVEGSGALARGGPVPAARAVGGARTGGSEPPVGYYGRPVLKPPPWTWEVPVYLFVGGVAGSSAVLAFAAKVGGGGGDLVTLALRLAVAGTFASAGLLVSDLGRPARFLNMLRVFKPRSPMSVGVWVLALFGAAAAAALLLDARASASGGAAALEWSALGAAALLGALVATYTGVLLAATVVPAWNSYAGVLPVHFGAAALGSAAALLELLVGPVAALHGIGVAAAAAETLVWIWTEARRNGARDRALRSGRAGRLVRASALLSGPAALLLRLAGLRAFAAAAFLAGALLGRFGWIRAGAESTADPEAAL